MTRATAKPVRRVVLTRDGEELVVEVTDRTVRLRPLGCRRGGPAEIEWGWGKVYLRAMADRVEEQRKERARKRGARRGRRG